MKVPKVGAIGDTGAVTRSHTEAIGTISMETVTATYNYDGNGQPIQKITGNGTNGVPAQHAFNRLRHGGG